jgi:TolB-like protein/class 3 adenylate cyclase/Flp pilus assembly protein TadD
MATGTKRKLAAILYADVVGYTRLMSVDEVGTHNRLVTYRRATESLINGHSGRVVGTAGDAILADFPSVVEALAAAVEIQAALAQRNASLAAEERLEFRIGINLGDVIVDGNDIFGDGVNVAARIEELADPGGIAVSAAVFDQVRNKSGYSFHDRGAHRVKNIAEPVRVYSVGAAGGRVAPRRRTLFERRAKLALAVLALVAVVVAAALFWWKPLAALRGPDVPSVAGKSARTDRPTVAVLPFDDRGGDADQNYFSDGVTEDVIANLGRFSDLLVLSWNAVAPYKARSVEPKELSRALNVRYVVGGTLQRAGDRIRVTVQLTDAEQGVLLWSERYDEQLSDIFEVQDRIARQVVGALAVRVTDLETQRAFDKPTADLGAYELVLRARELLRRVERDSNLQARGMLQRASALDPDYSEAHVGEGQTHLNDFLYGWSEWPDRAIERAGELATQAIELDERNASAHLLLAEVMLFRGDLERAREDIERALTLNPNDAMGHAILGQLLLHEGQPEEAVPALELALRLDPNPVAWWVENLARAYYFLGRDGDAVRLRDRFGKLIEEHPGGPAILAAAYGQLGEGKAAAEMLASLRRVSPFFDAETFARNLSSRPEHEARLLDGLHKAGIDATE